MGQVVIAGRRKAVIFYLALFIAKIGIIHTIRYGKYT